VAEAEEKNSGTEEAGGDAAEAVKKKSGGEAGGGGGPNQKFIFLILILNAVVLTVLAAVVWMGYSKSSKQVSLADVAASSEKSAKEGDGHSEGGEKKEGDAAADNRFIKESFMVNLADPKGARFAKVDVEIEVDDDFVRAEINRIKPKIRDFILVVLSSKTHEQVESPDGRDFLREEIRNKINGYLTRGQIKNVFFTQFIVQ